MTYIPPMHPNVGWMARLAKQKDPFGTVPPPDPSPDVTMPEFSTDQPTFDSGTDSSIIGGGGSFGGGGSSGDW